MATHQLDGTTWRLVAYRSGDELVDIPQDATVTLRFDLPAVGGKSGINQYHGTVQFSPGTNDTAEGKLTFTGFASTMMAGPEPLMALEARYLELLQTVQRWSMADDLLTLQDAAGLVVLRCERDPRS
jgi:heat shock protein HslJ